MHGSKSIYPNEEAYLNWQDKLAELRKEESSEMKVKMLFEKKEAGTTKTHGCGTNEHFEHDDKKEI